VVATSVVVELQEQLLVRERELDSREGAIVTWEDGLATSKRALGRAGMERNAERAHIEAVRQNSLTRSCTLTSNSKNSINLNQMLEEIDLEVREAKLAQVQACGLHSYDRLDLSAELEELHVCMARVKD
jgi:hypothetical protein